MARNLQGRFIEGETSRGHSPHTFYQPVSFERLTDAFDQLRALCMIFVSPSRIGVAR